MDVQGKNKKEKIRNYKGFPPPPLPSPGGPRGFIGFPRGSNGHPFKFI